MSTFPIFKKNYVSPASYRVLSQKYLLAVILPQTIRKDLIHSVGFHKGFTIALIIFITITISDIIIQQNSKIFE